MVRAPPQAPNWALEFQDSITSRLDAFEVKLNSLVRLAERESKKENIIMSQMDDANTQMDAILASTAEETDLLTAIASGVNDVKAQNLDLAQQLADAIANGANPAAVSALVAKMTTLNEAVNGQKLAEAAIKNTLAATPVPPVGP